MCVEEPLVAISNSIPYSVLMSVYGGDNAAHFATALDSILNQTMPSDDIVLTIDGPIDGDIRDTIERYISNNPQIHPVWFPKNIGLGAVRSVGLPKCQHDIVLIMDADDISAPDRAEKEVAFLATHPDIDVVSATLTEFVDEPDNIVCIKRIPLAHADIVDRAKRWNPINHAATALRKSSALAVGGYQAFPRHEDYYLWIRMLNAGFRFASIDQTLINVRISGDALERRRSFPTVLAATQFHLWKHRVGFAGRIDTALMIAFMFSIKAVPGPLYRALYQLKRRYRGRHPVQGLTLPPKPGAEQSKDAKPE